VIDEFPDNLSYSVPFRRDGSRTRTRFIKTEYEQEYEYEV